MYTRIGLRLSHILEVFEAVKLGSYLRFERGILYTLLGGLQKKHREKSVS